MRWQHVYPIRTDEPEYHEEEVEPTIYPGDNLPSKVCKWCRKTIKQVDDNEGPESLKALLRF